MSNHPLLTTVCAHADKLFKIWPISSCIWLIWIVIQAIVGTSEAWAQIYLLCIPFVALATSAFDFYIRKQLITDLSTMLSGDASPIHKDIEFLKKFLLGLGAFFVACVFVRLFQPAIKLGGVPWLSWAEKIPYGIVCLLDIPLKILFFIKFKKFKTLCGL